MRNRIIKYEPNLSEEVIEALRIVSKDVDPRIADIATGILIKEYTAYGSYISNGYIHCLCFF